MTTNLSFVKYDMIYNKYIKYEKEIFKIKVIYRRQVYSSHWYDNTILYIISHIYINCNKHISILIEVNLTVVEKCYKLCQRSKEHSGLLESCVDNIL